jgi:8-oxo-dGTP diphosphatase
VSQKNQYAGFIRVRVGGLYLEKGKLLLIRLTSPISGEEIWIPPGGGVDFKESFHEALIREFKEETTLDIAVDKLRFISELIDGEFHVIEFFFDVVKLSGDVNLGYDPEHSENDQLISEIGFFSKEEILEMNVKPAFLKKEFWDENNSELFFSNR